MKKVVVTFKVDETHPEMIEALKDANGSVEEVFKDENMIGYLGAEEVSEIMKVEVSNWE